MKIIFKRDPSIQKSSIFYSGCVYNCNIFLLLVIIFSSNINGYTLPTIGLGSSSFLDGGPLRQIPGWYAQIYNQVYTTHRFLDARGTFTTGSPEFKFWSTAFQFIYLSQSDFFGLGNAGFDIALPMVFYSRLEKNVLGITNAGTGIGDLIIGAFVQPEAIFRDGKPLYVNRFEFDVSIPTGKNKRPDKTINPGNGFLFINPYWSATLYVTQRLSASWRLNYLWCTTNHVTHIRAGGTIYGTYALEYQIRPRFFLGINGYFLQQLQESTLSGVKIPDSKERVVGIGVGGLFSFARRFANVLIVNFYWETLVRNRTQGFKFLVRYLRHF